MKLRDIPTGFGTTKPIPLSTRTRSRQPRESGPVISWCGKLAFHKATAMVPIVDGFPMSVTGTVQEICDA
jgi:hypothetical protein